MILIKNKPYRDKEILKYKITVEGKNVAQIAKELGCDHTTAKTWIEKFDLNKEIKNPNSLSVSHPNLMREWDFEKNNKLGLNPEQLTYGSSKRASWICSKCGHQWVTAIGKRGRASNPTGCGNCAGIVVNETNNLSVLRPDIAVQWDYTKNKDSPDEYHCRSNKEAYWLCEVCGHSWKTKINTRTTKNDSECRKCSGWLLTEENSLAGRFPNIAELWDYEVNYPTIPEEVFGRSGKKYYWVCSEGHSTPATVSNKVSGNTTCRECTKGQRTSFPEQAVYFYIRKVFPDAINGYSIRGNIAFDIFIPEIKMIIEYDGFYFHQDKFRMEADIEKDKIAIDMGLTLIRMRERGLQTLDTSLSIENVDDNLDKAIISVMQKIANECNDKLTVDEIEGLYNVDIDHKKHFSEIGSQMIVSYVENNITKTNPELLSFWDYDKNSHLFPEQVSYGSHRDAHWKCLQGHEWSLKVYQMLKRKHNKCLTCKEEDSNKN